MVENRQGFWHYTKIRENAVRRMRADESERKEAKGCSLWQRIENLHIGGTVKCFTGVFFVIARIRLIQSMQTNVSRQGA